MEILKILKALSDETRLRIFNLLLFHELNVNDIMIILNMGQSRVSRHLKILYESGLVIFRRDGLWVYYSAVLKSGEIIDAIKNNLEDESVFINDIISAKGLLNKYKEETKGFFNSVAEDWDLLKRNIFGSLDTSTIILSKIEKCIVAVDLGCGTGDLIIHLLDKAEKIIGVDNSPRMLEEARRRFLNNNSRVDIRIGEMEHLPLKDNETNTAVLNMALHHLAEPETSFFEVNRVLYKKGIFIITELDKHENEMMRTKYGDRWLGFKKEEIQTWFEKSGFKLTGFEQFPLNQDLKLNVFVAMKV